MRVVFLLTFFFFCSSLTKVQAQKTIDSPFKREQMRKDLKVFYEVREAANSGVYKYRSEEEINSIYRRAEEQIDSARTFLDFYKIICSINSFEGSLHNELFLPPKVMASLREESEGYFPYPVKMIGDEVLLNYVNPEIPVGSVITSIDGFSITSIVPQLYKYYPTDGFSIAGKKSGINENFSKYFRFEFGKKNEFSVEYNHKGKKEKKKVKSIGYKEYYSRFDDRHSKPIDDASYPYYDDLVDVVNAYDFEALDTIGVLTVNSFLIGWGSDDPKHKEYLVFLDSVFTVMNEDQIKYLIVDVRHNGGGSDPNDLVTYSYLTARSFVENRKAWISFQKIPFWKHVREVSWIMRPVEKFLSNRGWKDSFPIKKGSRFYQSLTDPDKIPRKPSPKAFQGQIFLLVGPRTASAGSLFAALLASDEGVIVVGDETQGGYYGHNGHIPIRYRMPKSKIKFMFSIVNLEQDVVEKESQPFGSGIIPDIEIFQTHEDFVKNKDTVMQYTIDLIRSGDL